MNARIVTSHPTLTPEKLAELQALGRKIDAEEKDQIIAKGRAFFRRQEIVRSIIQTIRDERLRQNLSLDEVGSRIGIDKGNLSRLENEASPNPTIGTMLRYAEGVGVKLTLTVSGD
ncbi:MAG TPA: helix-turn-helix transcriptional regulator [Tepidisphaeraceae bacterium]|jgi:ribosome-binding protein aMBF1 (putative translation factor)